MPAAVSAAPPAPAPTPPDLDAFDAHALRALAATVRTFGRDAAAVRRRWFAPRGPFDPIDELAFEHEWRRFVQRGVALAEELERALPAVRHGFAPRRPPALERFEEQLVHVRAWSAALRLVTRFASARVLLEAALPHDEPPTTPHRSLCCCAATLDELAALRPDPALPPPQLPEGDPMTRVQEEFDAAIEAAPTLARLGPAAADPRRALRSRWTSGPTGLRAHWNAEARAADPASGGAPAAPADSPERPDGPPPRGTDPRAVKFNQGVIAVVTTLALLSGDPWLLLPLGAVLAAGTLDGRLALFKRFFALVLRPALRLPPARHLDDPRPHAFAQGMVAATTLLAWLAFALGLPLVGVALAGMNVALCAIAVAGDWCLGCQVYLHARRLRWRFGRHV